MFSTQEDEQCSAGANSDSDAEFEQMLAEAEEPKPADASTSAAGDEAPIKDDNDAQAQQVLFIVLYGFASACISKEPMWFF